jgi:4-hydroxy-tetrahydrodipicolinate synthase
VTRVWKQFEAGDIEAAGGLQKELQTINEAMFYETNPIPVKTALAMMGRIREEFRLPLTKIGDQNREKLRGVLEKYGLI